MYHRMVKSLGLVFGWEAGPSGDAVLDRAGWRVSTVRAPAEQRMMQGRSLQKLGARLALMALWLQLVLALGHNHASDIFLYGHPVAQSVDVQQVAANKEATPIPLAPQSQGAAVDLACAICATVALAGSTVLPDLVRLAPPPPTVTHVADDYVAVVLNTRAFLLFQTRAPPSV